MRKRSVLFMIFMVMTLSAAMAFAEQHTAEERGKAHFNNQAFAGGKKSCNACHPNGRGLEGAGAKPSFTIMGGQQASLEEAINVCIVNANKGNALAVDSVEMQEMASYIRSLGAK